MIMMKREIQQATSTGKSKRRKVFQNNLHHHRHHHLHHHFPLHQADTFKRLLWSYCLHLYYLSRHIHSPPWSGFQSRYIRIGKIYNTYICIYIQLHTRRCLNRHNNALRYFMNEVESKQ